MVIEDTLFVLLRRTPPEKAIDAWLKSIQTKEYCSEKPLSLMPDEKSFYTALQNQFPHYSVNEAEYAYQYAKELSQNCSTNETGIFGLLAESVKDFLTTDIRNECLCKYKKLLEFRELTHPIDPLIFMAAYLAKKDIDTSFIRKVFSWPIIMHSDNERLDYIMDKGMAENHFHIGGSSSAFQFSWICLMNNFSPARKKEFEKENLDTYSLDSVYSPYSSTETYYTITFKAVCIRLFLYLRLKKQWVLQYSPSSEKNIKEQNDEWLIKMLSATETECDLYASEVSDYIHTLKKLAQKDDCDFIPDYATKDEPLPPLDDEDSEFYHGLAVRNYERRLFNALAGEQKFLYDLFSAIYKGDESISPYYDLAYAYLLIYCKLRSELMQVNNRVGFGNFLKYQDRKDIFTENFPLYDIMRTRIAQQVVLLNPQIVSFEGRLCPANTADKLIKKIENLYNAAIYVPDNDDVYRNKVKNTVDKKLHYVLHFPKSSQEYHGKSSEFIYPRDNKKREQIRIQSSAIIDAIQKSPDKMALVKGIDACSNEIDCRPEVFAPDFRRIRQFKYDFDDFIAKHPRPNMRISYHVGEDFLDPIDGLRAIDEAITFLEMKGGDRLGHALALGVDCEEWYGLKHHTVLLKKQALLDNLTWLYGKMHHYNIQNTAAEDQIFKWFKKLYTDIYTNSLTNPSKSLIYSVDVLDYYTSLRLRGNEPTVYFNNPDGTIEERQRFEKTLADSELDMWKLRNKAGKTYDLVSNALYHYYHFDSRMKLASDRRIEYFVPKCIIDAVCMVQEKMQYDISLKSICIECNPSSNYLIGTFKDYLKHPIFKFNNKFLYSDNDKRHSMPNPRISASINTDDLGIFDTSLENEFALMACALERHNQICADDEKILPDNIYSWLDNIREMGCMQSFRKI